MPLQKCGVFNGRFVNADEVPQAPGVEAIGFANFSPVEIDRHISKGEFDSITVRVDPDALDPSHIIQSALRADGDPFAIRGREPDPERRPEYLDKRFHSTILGVPEVLDDVRENGVHRPPPIWVG